MGDRSLSQGCPSGACYRDGGGRERGRGREGGRERRRGREGGRERGRGREREREGGRERGGGREGGKSKGVDYTILVPLPEYSHVSTQEVG